MKRLIFVSIAVFGFIGVFAGFQNFSQNLHQKMLSELGATDIGNGWFILHNTPIGDPYYYYTNNDTSPNVTVFYAGYGSDPYLWIGSLGGWLRYNDGANQPEFTTVSGNLLGDQKPITYSAWNQMLGFGQHSYTYRMCKSLTRQLIATAPANTKQWCQYN